MLAERRWKRKYTREDGDLVRLFYIPALEDAERYDRLTGYFSAGALALAARGIEGLVRNSGRMRLLVGCTLEPAEIEAIRKGESLRRLVERHLESVPLAPPDPESSAALELLAWMVASGHLEVKVGVPCDSEGRPVPDQGIFHEKAGVVADRAGDRLAWNGSLNETAAGWRRNWESINVFTSWGLDPRRVDEEEANFASLWANRNRSVAVLAVPDAVRQDLMRFRPREGEPPVRLKERGATREKPLDASMPKPKRDRDDAEHLGPDMRSRVWSFIAKAPSLSGGAARVGEATSAVIPWAHQVRAFNRLYGHWPPRLLIADEVGLGKTIQAGLVLRQAWLAGRAKRILILAPKAVLRQWQIELREKFNLNWPIYDGHRLRWYPSPAMRGKEERRVDARRWHETPAVIASSHLMRRRDRAAVLLDEAETWDMVVLDEAHHARRGAARNVHEGRPNALLRLMRKLASQTEGLVLLTATPMQLHPIEIWDLLNLLGLPGEWGERPFLDFFEDVESPNPSEAAMERIAALFRAVEARYGEVEQEDAARATRLSMFKARKVLRALRDRASIPRRQLETPERMAAVQLARAHTPVRRLVSRHTRELLRRYASAGALTGAIAERDVQDRFISMTSGERALYGAVEDYIVDTYNHASKSERTAVGFVLTIYGRRLASSFFALRKTLRRHLDAVIGDESGSGGGSGNGNGDRKDAGSVDGGRDGTGQRHGGRQPAGDRGGRWAILDEDLLDDEIEAERMEADEAADRERQAMAGLEANDIRRLLGMIDALPPDSKLAELQTVLDRLREGGFGQTMVFTQFTDTMDFLRDSLHAGGSYGLMCFSGRGGEIPTVDGGWRVIDRDEVKRRFRDGEADLLLCTDAAAEGLNFQFCGSVVNYDMPWNPMRVEQRIGRIDRVGQKHDRIRIVNLNYEDTIETDVYRALRDRIGLFETVVGRLQPILARLPGAIADAVRTGDATDEARRARVVDKIEQQARESETGGFDLDAVLEDDIAMPERPTPAMEMPDLDRVIGNPDLMPPGTVVAPLGQREYSLLAPGMSEAVRVTTDPAYYEQHAESMELWSPGNPLFKGPELVASVEDAEKQQTLARILDP